MASMSLSAALSSSAVTRELRRSALFLPAMLLIISMFLWAVQSPRYSQVVLFFPGAVRTGISGELRAVPAQSSREAQVEQVIKEVLLGPLSVERGRVLPKNSEMQLFMFRQGAVYIDFPVEVFLDADASNLTFSEARAALERSIRFNHPFVRKVIVTINGQIPFEFPQVIE